MPHIQMGKQAKALEKALQAYERAARRTTRFMNVLVVLWAISTAYTVAIDAFGEPWSYVPVVTFFAAYVACDWRLNALSDAMEDTRAGAPQPAPVVTLTAGTGAETPRHDQNGVPPCHTPNPPAPTS